MVAKDPFHNPNYWRERAEETRAKAEAFGHRPSKNRLLKIAEEYEQLARRAEERQMVNPQKQNGSVS